MMDAKIRTIDLKKAKELRLFATYDDGKIEEVGTTHLRQFFEYVESLAAKAELTDGVSLIAAERQRQIEQEGWTAEYDNQHRHGELAIAASCYALPKRHRPTYENTYGGVTRRLPMKWPWAAEWWKPTPDDRIRELTKAGALIAAEIDRLRAGGGMR